MVPTVRGARFVGGGGGGDGGGADLTVTTNSGDAVSPPVSAAGTAPLAVQGLRAANVSLCRSTLTGRTRVAKLTASKRRESPSGSPNYAVRSRAPSSSSSTLRDGISPVTVGARFGTVTFKLGFRRGWHPIRIRMWDNDWAVQVRNGYVAGRARLTRR